MKTDTGAKGLQSVPEFAGKTIAVLRAELGDVDRFACSSQAVAYAGLDIEVKQSGKSKGKPSSPSEAAGAFDASCIWPSCAVSDSKTRPLGPTTITWWLAVYQGVQP